MIKNDFIIFLVGILMIFSGCDQEALTPEKHIELNQEIVKPKIIDSIVWDGTYEYINSYKYDKAIKSYVDNKYPKKVKQWNEELKKQEKIRLVEIERKRKERLKREAIEERERLKREAKLKKEKLKKERQEKARLKREKLKRERAYNTKTVGKIMWEDHHDANTNEYTWSEANKYCKNMSWLGYDDWRLPTYNEFKQLYKLQNRNKLKHFNNSNLSCLFGGNPYNKELECSIYFKSSWTATYGLRKGRIAYNTSPYFTKDGDNINDMHFARCVRRIGK